MGGFIDMYTTAVGQLMNRLADAGSDLDTDWKSVLGAITDGEDFGGDAIAQAIRGAYGPAGDALRELAAQLPRAVMSDADAGAECAMLYRSTDAKVSARLGAVRGADIGTGDADARS